MMSKTPLRFAVCLGFTISVVMSSHFAIGQEFSTGCSEALVLDTYNESHTSLLDWRLASFVTEEEWTKIKNGAKLDAVIYDVPIGASYDEFQENIKKKTNSLQVSLNRQEATNVMWTGLDPSSSPNYQSCLKARFGQHGLHLMVNAATPTEVSVLASYNPTGPFNRSITPVWSWSGQSAEALPKTLVAGETPTTLPRPKVAQLLTVTYLGSSDTIVITPFPAPPKERGTHMEEESETIDLATQTGWGDNWSPPGYIKCTDPKPAGWTIKSVSDLLLASGNERGACGGWVECGGTQGVTYACKSLRVQGHNEKPTRFDGYGSASGKFTVVWNKPVANAAETGRAPIPDPGPQSPDTSRSAKLPAPFLWLIGVLTLLIVVLGFLLFRRRHS
jgi:hypothetical protein